MNPLDPILRRYVRRGRLTVETAGGKQRTYGEPAAGFPQVAVRFADRRAELAVTRNPELGTAEMIMDGRLIVEKDDIRGLIELVRANARWDREGEIDATPWWQRGFRRTRHKLDRLNWPARSRRNVAHHYDLSDELYSLFLDADRQYSCAYFEGPAGDLETAQRHKVAHILAKLNLKPGVSALDIGCGWGGTALAIHRVTGGEVLGITLSEHQLEVARERAKRAGVAGKVRFELLDYRRLEGKFDRIVSVGMFEHVGPPHYRRFFRQCRRLLAHDGVMLLHTIGRMGTPGTTSPFTAKYIFPGGYIPALSEIVRASEPARLIATDIETLRLHYAHTLDHWYDRTVAARDRIVDLYDERFYRMWLFYLAGAAASFRHGGMCVYQLQYIRDRHALPITRGWMAEEEQRIRLLLSGDGG